MRTGGDRTGDSRQDVPFFRFYRQVAGRHAARHGTGYDIAADASRSSDWAGARTPRPGEILTGPRGKHVGIPGPRADRDADHALAALYGQHYAALVRLASLLVADALTAEEIVQDSFVALHASRRRLRDGDWALYYLHRSVLYGSRSMGRSPHGAERKAAGRAAEGPAEPRGASAAAGCPAVTSALPALPARQREAVVMRYYAGLPEARVAQVMGISRRAARRHTERGMAALRALLDTAGDPGRLGAVRPARQPPAAGQGGRPAPPAVTTGR